MSEYYVGMTENRNMHITYRRLGMLPLSITVDAKDGMEPLRYVPERTCDGCVNESNRDERCEGCCRLGLDYYERKVAGE